MKLQYAIKSECDKLKGTDGETYFDALSPNCEMELVALKNGWAAFQIAILSDCDYALNVGTMPWFSQYTGKECLRVAVDCAFETEVNIIDMHPDDEGIDRADALLSARTVEIKAGEVRAVWVEMKIPSETELGKYTCTVRLMRSLTVEDESLMGEVTATVEVLDLALPAPRDFNFHLDLWQHLSNIARAHEVTPFGDAHFEVLEHYVKSLADLGQKAVTLVVSEAPWSGQSCYAVEQTAANLFEYSLIPVTKDRDGSFHYDYTVMQRYIDLCAKYGIDRELSVYGLCNVWAEPKAGLAAIVPDYPDGIKIRYLDLSDGCYKYMRRACEIDHYIASLEQYFCDTNQIDRVRIAADEPADIEAFRKSLMRIYTVAPSFKFKAAMNHAEFIDAFGEEIHDFAPYIRCVGREYDRLSQYRNSMAGKRFLWYVCGSPEFLNTLLKSELYEGLFIGILTSYIGFDGFLRWSFTVWNDAPRADGRYPLFPAGDTHLVYPAANGTPLLTLRYKALKRGIELYELLEMLKETGDTAAVEEAFDLVIREKDIHKYAADIVKAEHMCSLNYEDYQKLIKWIVKNAIQ